MESLGISIGPLAPIITVDDEKEADLEYSSKGTSLKFIGYCLPGYFISE